MVTLDRHIARTVFLAMAAVLLVLGGLDLLFTVVDELGDTTGEGGSGSYDGLAALRYVLLTFPRHIYELLPMTALIGALAGLGLLASGNELVAMQSAGVRVGRIVWAVMKPAFVVMLAGLLLGEYLAPRLELRAELGKALASGEDAGLSRYGHWQRDGTSFIHYNGADPEGVVHGISVLVFDDSKRIVASVEAERAIYQGIAESGSEAQWLLQSGRETRFSYADDAAGGVGSEQRQFESQPWALDLSPDLLQVLMVDPDKMAMSDLYRYAQRFERQGQNADLYFLSFWKKALQPLATAILVLVAISFVFGPLRQATMGSRVFTAICFGLGFTILQRLIHNMGLVYQLSPLVAVLLPLALSAVLGLVLFRRAA